MMTTRTLRIAGAVLFALASVHALAQPGAGEASAASNETAVAASGSMTAKDIRKANHALRSKVYAAIAKHKEISAGDISVVAKGGTVTLNGTVVDASQINTVTEVAKGVEGVTSVTSKLTVQKPFGGQ
jgi:hyperosmotically inducible periplasmic protein